MQSSEHMQAEQHPQAHQVMPHQLQQMDPEAQMQHHLHASMAEHGIPPGYTAADIAAWQQSLAHGELVFVSLTTLETY